MAPKTATRVRPALALALAMVLSVAPHGLQAQTRVLLDTDAGAITVLLFEKEAPVSATNFLRYVTDGRYDGGAFYRAVTLSNQPTNDVKIEVIQGGLDRDGAKRLPPIAHETTDKTGITHTDGTLSMARAGVGSAAGEFFIVIGNQPELDFGGKRNADGQGFAAFGRVVEGMDVARRIQRMPADSAPPQRLATVVQIKSARVVP
ncbi:MAG TPA: peptidylprolyl isomerase [Gemmatimonas sp.]|nr:peptidylprolyl isomerase [Gemmatimonas sp.]